MLKKLLRLTAPGLIALCLPLSGNASLIGDTVNCAEIGGGSFECDPFSATVIDPGAEFFVGNSGSSAGFDVDIQSESIVFTALQELILGATIIQLSSLDWAGMTGGILGATFQTAGSVSGLEVGDLTFTTDSITFDFIDTVWANGASATVTLEGSHAVPSPSILALLGLGLVGLGLSRRKH